ncbi:hypothetical protein ABFS83_10G016400 [Erythranthe nasuta]
MDQVEQLPAGGESSGAASASAAWENSEESPPLPFPERSPELPRSSSDRERFAGMDNEGYVVNNEGSPVIGNDAKSCLVSSTAFSIFVAMVVAFSIFAPETLRLGPSASVLINPSHLLVESVKVVALNAAKGSMLYGFHKSPPLDVTTTWSETHKITLPAGTHKEWLYYLNKGSEINISYSVGSLSSLSLVLVIVKGSTGLAEWLKDPSQPSIHFSLSWNLIHGNGSIQKDVYESSTYYIAVGNLNAEFAGVNLNTTIKAFLHNTTESYYKCAPAEGNCTFQLFLKGGNAAVLTSPARSPGMVSGDWYFELWFGRRWVTYLIGTGGMTSLLLLMNYFSNHFRRRDQLGEVGPERNALLSHEDGDSSASISDDDEHRQRHCAICFTAPKDCFFLPCGHSVACFQCATRIQKSSASCPICRRSTRTVKKIYTV